MSCKHRKPLGRERTCQLVQLSSRLGPEQTKVSPEDCERCGGDQGDHDERVVAGYALDAIKKSGVVVPKGLVQGLNERIDPTRMPCNHRGQLLGAVPCACPRVSHRDVYHCGVHGECVLQTAAVSLDVFADGPPMVCRSCPDKDAPKRPRLIGSGDWPDSPPDERDGPQDAQNDSPSIETPTGIGSRLRRPVSPSGNWPVGPYVTGLLTSSGGKPLDYLCNSMKGAAAVLVGGGRSTLGQDLGMLNQRGIYVAAMNNAAAGVVRPHAAIMVDGPGNFHPAIWYDPAVMKFIMRQRSKKPIREFDPTGGDDGQGRWYGTGQLSRRQPNVCFYEKSFGFDPDDFLTRDNPTWGGIYPKNRHETESRKSVMLVALRLLYWLGFRTIYLLGVDFHYRAGECYAWDEWKGPGGAGWNNGTMKVLKDWLGQLRPVFEKSGFNVLNASPGSRLDVFDRVPFEAAIANEVAAIPPIDSLRGMY